MKVKAKTKDKPEAVEFEVNIPEGLDAKVKLFGAEVVDAAAEGSLVISAQAQARRFIDKGYDAAKIAAEMKAWRPDVRQIVKQTAFERATSALDKLSPEERKALLSKLSAMK